MTARRIDDVKCPECGCGMTLVTEPIDGVRYRYCSYTSCRWGLDTDVLYEEPEHVANGGEEANDAAH